MATYLDGTQALFVLLDGLQAIDVDTGDPLLLDGAPVPPVTTHTMLPADLANRVAAGEVIVGISRAGWSDDQQETEGHDRIAVDVYGRGSSVARAVSQGIEDFLVDNFHDVPDVGFVDDVRRDSRWRIQPDPTDAYVRAGAVYRLISRPD